MNELNTREVESQEGNEESEANEMAASLSFATNMGINMLGQEALAGSPGEDMPMEIGEDGQEQAENGEIMPEEAPVEEVEEEVIEEPVDESILEEEAPEEEMKESVEDLGKGFEEFKGEVKGIIETKIDDLTKTIKDALKD